MAKNNNLHDYLQDMADAIMEKTGDTEPLNAQEFADKIRSIESGGSMWTGHADVEGLKAIGWDDEDIAYYQKHGVNWNEEDDEYHKVSDDNKALYGVLTANNISQYKDRIVYLPKIDFSGVASMDSMFREFYTLVAIPMLDISKCKSMNYTFFYCYSLTTIPPLDMSNITSLNYTFNYCRSLMHIPLLNTQNVTIMSATFANCCSLVTLPSINTENVTTMYDMCSGCLALKDFPELNSSKVTNMGSMFYNCNSLINIKGLDVKNAPQSVPSLCQTTYAISTIKLKNLTSNLAAKSSPRFNKESLLYIINNEAATSTITITLHSYAYQRLANDADIVEALNNHPLVSLASA